MITSFGFNGYLKPTSNLNMLFKHHDSGYYSFTPSIAKATNNFPLVDNSGFCQIIVEEKGTMAAQYLYYHNNESFYRVGDVNNGLIQWSAWNQLLGPDYFDDKETKEWANSHLFPLYHDTPGIEESIIYGDNRYWITPDAGVNGYLDGYDKATFKDLGVIANNMLVSTLSTVPFLNGWYYKSDNDKGDFPVASSGILKVYSSNHKDSNYGPMMNGQKRLIFITTGGAYYMGEHLIGGPTITWNQLATIGSTMMTDLYNTLVSSNKYIRESFISDIRFGAPVYSPENYSFNYTTGKFSPNGVYYYCVDVSYKYVDTLFHTSVHRPMQYNKNGEWVYARFTDT